MNANLYYYEKLFAEYEVLLNIGDGKAWESKAKSHAEKMNALMRDSLTGVYRDYNYKTEGQSPVISAASFQPYFAGFAGEEQKSGLKKFNKASGNVIKKVTVAPEEDGAEELIKYLKDNQIIASIGHSNATAEEVKGAVICGAESVTHTFNAQSPFKHRDIGVAGSALLNDELCCEIIADGVHVSFEAIKLLVKNKPKDKITLITDAIRAKGLGEGESELGG